MPRLGRDLRTAIRNLSGESPQHRNRARDAGARHRREHVNLQHPGLGDLAARPVPRRGSAGRAGQLQRRAQVQLSRHVADVVGRLASADGPFRSRRSVRASVVRLPQRQRRRDGVRRDRLARAVRDARRARACRPMVRERRRPRRRRSTGGRERHVLAVDAARRRWRRRATHHARRRRLRDRRRHAGDVPLSRRTHGSLAAVRPRRTAARWQRADAAVGGAGVRTCGSGPRGSGSGAAARANRGARWRAECVCGQPVDRLRGADVPGALG